MSTTRLGLGCVTLGSASSGRSEGDDVRLVADAVERGVTVFDTADVYGSGASERVLGRALRNRRADVVLATKGGYLFRERTGWEQWARRGGASVARRLPSRTSASSGLGAAGGTYGAHDFSPAHLRGAIEASLRRLQTDHIDVYQLHGPRLPDPGLVESLADLVTAGTIGRFGVGAERVEDAAAWAVVEGIEVVQLPFGILDPEAAAEVFPLARARSVAVWARGVLGGGVLKAAAQDLSALAEHPKRDLVRRLTEIARGAGIGIDELAMGYVVAHAGNLDTILVGTGSPDHLARNVQLVAAPPLPPDVLLAVEGAIAAAATSREHRG